MTCAVRDPVVIVVYLFPVFVAPKPFSENRAAELDLKTANRIDHHAKSTTEDLLGRSEMNRHPVTESRHC